MPWRDESVKRYVEFIDRALGEQPLPQAEIKRRYDSVDRIVDSLHRIRDSENGYKLSQEMLTLLIAFDAENFLLFPADQRFFLRVL